MKGNVTFVSIDLRDLLHDDPIEAGSLLSHSFELIRSNKVGAVHALTVYDSWSKTEEAFTTLAKREHIGKIVLRLNPADVGPVVPRELHPVSLKPDVTYVLVGGLGGLGRSVAMHLLRRGARYFAFISRSGATKPEQHRLLDRLSEGGATAKDFKVDITSFEHLSQTIEAIRVSMPPIKGCLQLAMIMKDNFFDKMPFEDWEQSTSIKIQGSWNLHQLLPGHMDFLILFSSIAATFGNRSQANYVSTSSRVSQCLLTDPKASGNAFLDGLAHHRRGKGMHTIALNLPAIRGLGWITENDLAAVEFFVRAAGVLSINEHVSTTG